MIFNINVRDILTITIIVALIETALILVHINVVQHEIESEMERHIITQKNNLLKNINVTTDNIYNTFVYQSDIKKDTILRQDRVEVSRDDFTRLSQIDKYPFRDAIQNLRYSPIIYWDDINRHINVSREILYDNYALYYTNINGNILVPDGDTLAIDDDIATKHIIPANNTFYIPIYNADPSIFAPSVIGFDLYSFTDTGINFFDKITNLDNTYISAPISAFGNSKWKNDNGIYIGSVVHRCNHTKNHNFTNLILTNKEDKCIYGVSYTAILMRDLMDAIIDRSNINIDGDVIKSYQVYDINERRVAFAPNNTDVVFDDVDYTDHIDIDNDDHHMYILLTFESRYLMLYLELSNEIESDDLKDVFRVATTLFIIVEVLIGIVCITSFTMLLSSRNIARDKNKSIQTSVEYMNHELRTPIMIRNGFSEVAMKHIEKIITMIENNNITLDDLLERINTVINHEMRAHKAGKELELLVGDAMDAHRIERGALRIMKEDVTVKDIIDRFNNEMNIITKSATNIVFEDDIECPDIIVRTDPTRVKQILTNYMTNAIRHTGTTTMGHITLIAKNTDKGVKITIRDDGVGISDGIKKDIFKKKFNTMSINDSRTGMGIGLYLCRLLSDMLKTEIGFTTEEGLGSDFWIIIPSKN